MKNRDMDIETQIGDRDMPAGMNAQRGRGDIEEEMQLALPDLDMDRIMPRPIDDKRMINDVESRAANATVDVDEPESLRMPRVDVEADLDDPGAVEPMVDMSFDVGGEM